MKPKHLTSAHQKRARAAVSSESCAANGRKGAQATIAKYGHETLFQASRRRRLLNPSMPELVTMGLLARLDLKPQRDYQREWRLGQTLYTVDFYFPALERALEIHGRIHQVFKVEARARHDQFKAWWMARHSVGLLVVDYTEFDDLLGLHQKLKRFLQPETQAL